MTTARYYTPPPNNQPDFICKHYGSRVARDLIKWAREEYDMALKLFTKRGAWKTVDYLTKEYSAMRVLSEMPNFRHIVSLITEDEYNRLSGRERVFIRRAYEIYEALR